MGIVENYASGITISTGLLSAITIASFIGALISII